MPFQCSFVIDQTIAFDHVQALRPANHREARAAAKARVNRFRRSTATELQSSDDMFFSTRACPVRRGAVPKVHRIGHGYPSDFELNFGRYVPALGRADNDDRYTQPDRDTHPDPGFVDSASLN